MQFLGGLTSQNELSYRLPGIYLQNKMWTDFDFPLEKAEAVVKAALHCFLNLENKVYGKALICKGA